MMQWQFAKFEICNLVFLHGHFLCMSILTWKPITNLNVALISYIPHKIGAFDYMSPKTLLLDKYQRNVLSVPYLHEIFSILAQPHLHKFQNAWKYGSNRRQKTVSDQRKGDLHLFHLINIFFVKGGRLWGGRCLIRWIRYQQQHSMTR